MEKKIELPNPLQPEGQQNENCLALQQNFKSCSQEKVVHTSVGSLKWTELDAEKRLNLVADTSGQAASDQKASKDESLRKSRENNGKNKKLAIKKRKTKTKPKPKTQEEIANDYYQRKIKYSDGLALRPVPFKDLYEKVKKPSGAEVEDGLPSWNTRPLDTKLNIIPAPHDTFVCARERVGERLWKTYEGGDFVFYDPYGYEFNIRYDPLHDKHLKRFFKNPKNVAFLQRTGTVTENCDAVCTLKEYNSYRKYLYKIYSEDLRKELLLKNSRDLEEMMIKRAVNNTKREIENKKRRELIAIKLAENEIKRETVRQQKAAKCLNHLQRIEEVQKEAERRKQEAIVMAEERHAEFKSRIQQRVILAEEIAHKRKIEALLLRQETDAQQKFYEEQKRIKRMMDRENKIRETWNQKISNQNFGLKRENHIRDARAKYLQSKAKKRLKINFVQKNIRDEKLKALQKQIKEEKEKNYSERLKKSKTCVTFAESVLGDRKDFKGAPKTIKKLITRFRRVNENEASFVASDRVYLSPKEKLPIEVKDFLSTLMNNVIKAYVKQEVTKAARILINDAMNLYDAQVQEWQEKNLANTLGKRQSLLAELSCVQPTEQSKEDEELSDNITYDDGEKHVVLQAITFGETEIIATEIQIDRNLKSIKTRELTPFPSLEDISPDGEMSSAGHSLPYKENLELLIVHMFQGVLDALETRILNHFFNTGDVTMLSEPPELPFKEQNIIDYVTSTLIYVTETVPEIDEDECVGEIARFISKHIFLFS